MTAIETCEMKLEEGRPEWSMGWVCERAILSNLISKVAGKRKKNAFENESKQRESSAEFQQSLRAAFEKWKLEITCSSRQSIGSRSRLAWQNTACCWLPWISRGLSRSKLSAMLGERRRVNGKIDFAFQHDLWRLILGLWSGGDQVEIVAYRAVVSVRRDQLESDDNDNDNLLRLVCVS